MLYKKDTFGTFVPVEKQEVIAEAKRIYSYSLRRGTKIENPTSAAEAIQTRLADKQHEVFTCLYLDTQHRVLGFNELFRGTIDSASVLVSFYKIGDTSKCIYNGQTGHETGGKPPVH